MVVAVPEPDAMREASYFIERLSTDAMPLAGLVINRTHPLPEGPAATLDADRATAAAESLEQTTGSSPLAAAALRLHADRVRVRERENRLRDALLSTHEGVRVAEVAALPEGVYDLPGLRGIGESLAFADRGR